MEFLTEFIALAMTAITLENAIFTWAVSYRSIVYLMGMTVIYVICHFALMLLPKRISSRANGYLSLATFNCAVLGSVMLAAMQSYTFAQYMGFGFGTGIGFTVAYWLVVEGRKRTELSSLPKSFRGGPAMILYIGIMSLAFYGLSGHQLPL